MTMIDSLIKKEKMIKDWYKENIEESVRDLVKYLRNNGVNTECSCEHENYIQCQYIPDGKIKKIYDLLYNYFFDLNEADDSSIDFEIKINVKVSGDDPRSSIIIKF